MRFEVMDMDGNPVDKVWVLNPQLLDKLRTSDCIVY
jgi:hypothetical protein